MISTVACFRFISTHSMLLCCKTPHCFVHLKKWASGHNGCVYKLCVCGGGGVGVCPQMCCQSLLLCAGRRCYRPRPKGGCTIVWVLFGYCFGIADVWSTAPFSPLLFRPVPPLSGSQVGGAVVRDPPSALLPGVHPPPLPPGDHGPAPTPLGSNNHPDKVVFFGCWISITTLTPPPLSPPPE